MLLELTGLELVDDESDVLRAASRHHEERVFGVDHDDVLEADHGDDLTFGSAHVAALRFDRDDVAKHGVVFVVALRELPLHKVDLRISKDVRIGRVRITGVAEAFNLFNHANFGSYNGQVNSTTFGDPRTSAGNAYVPRSGQLGFKVAF